MSILKINIVFFGPNFTVSLDTLNIKSMISPEHRTRGFQRLKFCQVYWEYIYMFYW